MSQNKDLARSLMYPYIQMFGDSILDAWESQGKKEDLRAVLIPDHNDPTNAVVAIMDRESLQHFMQQHIQPVDGEQPEHMQSHAELVEFAKHDMVGKGWLRLYVVTENCLLAGRIRERTASTAPARHDVN